MSPQFRITIRFLSIFLVICWAFAQSVVVADTTVSDSANGNGVSPSGGDDGTGGGETEYSPVPSNDPELDDNGPQLPPNPPPSNIPTRPSKPRFNRFNRWMKVLNEFFSQGNWLQGGPDNLLEYIGRTLSRLMDVLMNRDNGGETISTAELFGSIDPSVNPQGRGRSSGFARRGNPDGSQLTVADILKMIPQDRLNVPADRLFN